MPRPDFNQISSDLELRYGSTYVQYRGTPDSPFEPVFIRHVIPSEEEYPGFDIIGLKGRQIVSYRGCGEFNFSLPETRYYNYKDTGFVSFYKPSRQNKRSLCSSTNLRQNFYSQQRLIPHAGLDIYVADAIFNPTYKSFYETLELLNRQSKYCIALNAHYAMGLNITANKTHLLFHYFNPIAEITPDGKIDKIFDKSLEKLVYAAPISGL